MPRKYTRCSHNTTEKKINEDLYMAVLEFLEKEGRITVRHIANGTENIKGT